MRANGGTDGERQRDLTESPAVVSGDGTGGRVASSSFELEWVKQQMLDRILQNLPPADDRADEITPESLRRLQERVSSLHEGSCRVGQVPPRPPTLRGEVGMWLVLLVRRGLFWLIPPLQQVLREAAALLGEQLAAIDRLSQAVSRVEQETGIQIATMRAELDSERTHLHEVVREQVSREISAIESRWQAAFADLERRFEASLASRQSRFNPSGRNPADETKGGAG